MNSQKKIFESRELRTVSMNQLFGILDDNRQEEAYIFVRSLLEAQEKDEGLKNEEPEPVAKGPEAYQAGRRMSKRLQGKV